MWNGVLFGFALLHLIIFVWSFNKGFSSGDRNSAKLWLLRAMIFGMFYDNLVQGLGVWFINEPEYYTASVIRFLLHTAVLPWLTLFALSTMKLAGVQSASNRLVIAFCWLFTLVALFYGIYHEVYLLELGPKSVMGIEKLSNLSGIPPIPTILTNIIVIIMASAIWKRSGWKWLFMGAIFIFIINGATATLPWGFLTGNLAEVVFILSLLFTERHFNQQVNPK